MMLFVFQTFDASGQFYPFTYQGSLKDGNVPANGNYDIKLDLFNVPTGGVSQGGANYLEVPVVNGIFSLEFGGGTTSFFVPGLTYWVEVSVRPSGSSAQHTLLTPRQKITYTPYSISSILSGNTLKVGGIDASQYVLTTDARLSDARTPTPGSTSYIQNTTIWQENTSFNIGGNGTANIFNAQLGYWLTGSPILRRVGNSFMAGDLAGANTTTAASYSSFFGTGAGQNNTAGQSNSFFGYSAGIYNQTGGGNSFFGSNAGSNQTGNNNSIFGSTLLYSTPYRTGDFNSFFGHRAGQLSNGSFNSFFGTGAGFNNDSGSSNTFIGRNSGEANTSGSFNVTLGEFANFGGASLTNAAAIGSKAFVAQSNSIVLGSINGVNGATADTNVGIGTTTPANKLHVNGTIRVTNGAVYITNPNTVIITSPNGACWGITVNNSGALATFPVNPCP